AFDQFTDKHTFVDQGNMEIASHKAAIGILHFAWVGNDTFQALRLEVISKEHELAVAGHFAPVDNTNAWLFAMTGPLMVGVQQSMKDTGTCRQWADLVVA